MFTDISDRIAANAPALHYGVAALDVDGDGQVEFFVAGFGTANRVLKWVNGRLVDIAPPTLADADRKAIGVAAGDLDGDGREEIYVLNTDTFTGPKAYADRLFQAKPDGRWEDLFSKPGNRAVQNVSAGRSVVALDRRGTGRYGFFVANYGRPMRLFEQGSDGKLLDLAPSLGLDRTTGGRGLWAGPFASDRSDIICVNERGPNFLFKNDGTGHFRELAADYHLCDREEHARGIAVLDADGDGRLDLCYGNWDGPHRLMIRQPDGTFRDRATPAMAFPGTIRNVIAADFDNDGVEELFFNNFAEANRLFKRETDWRLQDPGPAAEPDGKGTGAAVADIDGDGVLELLIAHGEAVAQPLSLFKMPLNQNAWVRIAPKTRFDAPARGALVKLVAGGRTQLRVIDGGSGYLCQMEPVAHFGLGDAKSIESVSVMWPDGARQVVRDVRLRETMILRYPGLR